MSIYTSLVINKIEQITFWLLLILFPLFSLDKTDPFGFNKLSYFASSKLLRLIWLAITVITALKLSLKYKKDISYNKQCSFNIYIFLYLFFVCISILINTPSSIIAWYRFIELITVYLSSLWIVDILYNNLSKDNVILIIHRTVLYTFVTTIIIIIVLFLFDRDLIYISEIQDRTRLGGYAFSPNSLSIFFNISSISLYYFYRNNKLNTFFYITVLMFIHALVIDTGSRTGFLLLIIIDLILIYRSIIHYKFIIRILKYFSVICILVAMSFLLSNIDLDTFLNIITKSDDSLYELFTLNNRLSVFMTALDGIYSHPIKGHGYVEGVRNYLTLNYTLDFWQPQHTHNSILEVILSTGIIGSFFLLLAFYNILKVSYINIFSVKTTIGSLSLSLVCVIVFISSMTMACFGNVVINIATIFILCGKALLRYNNYGLEEKL